VAAIDEIEAKDIYAAPRTFYRHIQDVMERILQSIITVVIEAYVY